MKVIDELYELTRPKISTGSHPPDFIIIDHETAIEMRNSKRYFSDIQQSRFSEKILGIPILITNFVEGMKAVIKVERLEEINRNQLQ